MLATGRVMLVWAMCPMPLNIAETPAGSTHGSADSKWPKAKTAEPS